MMEEQTNIGFKALNDARKDGLLVQSEREFREEQQRILNNRIQRRQRLFDHFYGPACTQHERNEYYDFVDKKFRGLTSTDELYPKEITELMEKIRDYADKLRQLGVNEQSITELTRPKKRLSRLYVTPDYRIFLPEFNNMEVAIRPLPRAVFILFLRHPEGIRLKELSYYFAELLNIYITIMGENINMEKAKESIHRICDPLDNSINEKISRIQEAFRIIPDKAVAAEYVVGGERGEVHRILLSQSLVSWNHSI